MRRPIPSDTPVEVPIDLLYRIDSVTSLVAHRETRGLTTSTVLELKAVSAAVRALTNAAEKAAQPLSDGDYVRDAAGTIWMVTRDGGMLTRATYTGIVSCGVDAPDLAKPLTRVAWVDV